MMTKDEMNSAIDALLELLENIAELALQEADEQVCDCPLNLSNLRLFSNSTNELV